MSDLKGYYLGVAVESTRYAFDKLYTYCSLTPVSLGCRVIVPFGRGNRLCVGMVITCEENKSETENDCKNILKVLDKSPVLNAELLELVSYLRQTTFCTYYEAVRAFLPGAMQVKLLHSVTLVDNPPDVQLSFEEKAVLEQVQEDANPHKAINALPKDIIQSLCEKGVLREDITTQEKVKRQREIVMLRYITENHEEVSVTPTQQELLNFLVEKGDIAQRDACTQVGVTSAVANALVQKGLVSRYTCTSSPYTSNVNKVRSSLPQLSAEQQAAYDAVIKGSSEQMRCFLLYGVTGSGKTSVFLRLIEHVVQSGKQVILLVPEIALTPQTVLHFTRSFGDIVAVIHSELSQGQRRSAWDEIASGKAKIIIGTRSAIFAPVQSLGLIIIDEEDSRSYKSESAPRYHAITVAKKRCQVHHCSLVLASATPSIESFYYAQRGRYTLLELTQRYNKSPLPSVEIVDLQKADFVGEQHIFSMTLADALRDNFIAGHQSMLLLNRRGYHTIINCATCNQPVYCPNCTVPMTYHITTDQLMCHYCGYTTAMVTKCPHCGSDRLRRMGFGTQRLEEELQLILPKARILRMDADTTVSRGVYEEQFNAFRNGEYDIMLGTQMIGKGLDFPNVTLVGVLSIDKSLYAGDFRSYERTFSLITQVVGRSGRGNYSGKAILQTYMPEHYVLQLAARQDYREFYAQEIAVRRQLIFPPICDICVLGFTGKEETKVATCAKITYQKLCEMLKENEFKYPIQILNPVPCMYGKINRKYRWQLVVKCKDTKPYRDLIHDLLTIMSVEKASRDVTIYADMNGDIDV